MCKIFETEITLVANVSPSLLSTLIEALGEFVQDLNQADHIGGVVPGGWITLGRVSI